MRSGGRMIKFFLRDVFLRIRRDLGRTKTALFFLLFYAAVTQILFKTFCPYAILTGRACPACGMSRAGLALLRGQIRIAAGWNAAIFLWIPYLLYLCVLRYVMGRRVPAALPLAIFVCAGTLFWHILRLWAGTVPVVSCTGILHLVRQIFV